MWKTVVAKMIQSVKPSRATELERTLIDHGLKPPVAMLRHQAIAVTRD